MASTLAALLDGSGYNYVIIGGGHSPSKLMLTQGSAPTAPGLPVAANNGTVAPAGADSEPVIADPTAPVQAKTPQEIFDELRKTHPQ